MLYFPRSLIGDEASVTATISDMNALALKMFFNSLNCHASKLLEKVGCTDENWIQTMIYLIWTKKIPSKLRSNLRVLEIEHEKLNLW